jgi:BMFP domain-containing protein YqiC
MTTDPRLPTLEEVMNGNPFDIIDSPWGHIERWRASTLSTGTMGALAQVAAIVRDDAAELQEKTVALDAKKSAVLRTANKLLKFMSSVDALTARMDALEAKLKADKNNNVSLKKSL